MFSIVICIRGNDGKLRDAFFFKVQELHANENFDPVKILELWHLNVPGICHYSY
jgi:hypothetical protein